MRLPHLPGAVEPPLARRRRLRAERRTWALAAAALGAGGTLCATEVARAWPRRGGGADATQPAAEAFGQALEVAVRGYQEGSERENAVLSLLGSFTLTWALVRVSTHVIHRRGRWGPFRDFVVGRNHIHHFVPGIALAFVAGGAAVRDDPWLAAAFGTGVALTLDESALLLKLDDVYWTEEGIVSVQISLAAVAILSSLVLALRLLRRGERVVLLETPESSETPQAAAA